MKKTLLLGAACIFCHTLTAQTKSANVNIQIPKTHPWLLRGNKGTDTAVNFIGTTDIQPLIFKVYNEKAGYIDYIGANTALGSLSLNVNSIGNYNTAMGAAALFSNTEGFGNTAIGMSALYSVQSSGFNTAVGRNALYYNTSNSNTAVGISALQYNTEGSLNTAVGTSTLLNNQTGSLNTAIGSGADVSTFTESFTNATAVGYDAKVDASNKVQIGNTSVTSIGGQVGWTIYSDERVKQDIKENVPGLAFIKQLRPVTYHFSIPKQNELLGRKDTTEWKSKYDIEKTQFTGLIAQEVDAAAKKINYDFSGVDKTGKILGLRYAEFVVPLVKAVQELSKENEELKERLDKLEEMLSQQSLQNIELTDRAVLNQNIPNPANGTTTIQYYLPYYNNDAYINVYSSANVLLKSIKIVSKGNGSVNLKISDLSSGVYQYVLVVEGKVVDKKQMVIAK